MRKGILITEKQYQAFRNMQQALKTIAKEYQTPTQIRRDSQKQYGLDFEETLEMAYENIQGTAAAAVRGVKLPVFKIESIK